MSIFEPEIKIESDKSKVLPVLLFVLFIGLVLYCGWSLVELIKAIYA